MQPISKRVAVQVVGRAIAILLTALLVFLGPQAARAQSESPDCQPGERVLRFSHVVAPRGHPKGEAASELAAAVNTEMNGRACMVVYPQSELYTDDDVMDALLAGDVEFAAPSLSKLEPYTLRFRIFDLPFLFEDMDAVEWFQNSGPGARLRRSLAPQGFNVIAFWNSGMRQMSANRPLLMPADAVGLRFRIQNSELLRRMFDALSAESVRMPFRAVAEALETGEVDGQLNSYPNIVTAGLFEHQDGLTEMNHSVTAYILVTSAVFWEGLEPDIRRDLTRIILRVSKAANERARALSDEARAALIALGVPVRVLTPEQRAAWVEAASPVWDAYADEIGQDLIDAASSANR